MSPTTQKIHENKQVAKWDSHPVFNIFEFTFATHSHLSASVNKH